MDRGVAVVTGASAGVGRATVRAMASRGWSLGLLARDEVGLKEAADEVVDAGSEALPLSVDVADPAAVDQAADVIERDLGPIDVWVNDAMVGVFGPFLETEGEDFRRVVEVTFLGTVHGTRAALARMVPRDRGVVVQVGSALAYRGIPLQAAYCASKHAVRGFTESVRTELLHEGSAVRLCQVHLPAVNTPQFRWVKSLLDNEAQPVPPIYQPEVAAEAIAWVVDHPRRETWVGGSTVATILANRVAAGVLDRYLGRVGYRQQQTAEPRDRERPDNLYRPVTFGHRAHGAFDDRAASRSAQRWISRHRSALGGAAAMVAVGALLRRRVAPRVR